MNRLAKKKFHLSVALRISLLYEQTNSILKLNVHAFSNRLPLKNSNSSNQLLSIKNDMFNYSKLIHELFFSLPLRCQINSRLQNEIKNARFTSQELSPETIMSNMEEKNQVRIHLGTQCDGELHFLSI